MTNRQNGLPWRPISELTDIYRTELLLRAPELIDLDCNVHGIGMGYWQDGEGWLACKWSMTNDEWYEKRCTPTHFLVLEGPIDCATGAEEED